MTDDPLLRADAEETDRLREMGLESLAGDHPGDADGWADIERRGGRVGVRRRRLLAAAAALVLILGAAAGVAVARRAGERRVTTPGPSTTETYVLPPEGSTEVVSRGFYDDVGTGIRPDPRGYAFDYVDPSGRQLTLEVARLGPLVLQREATTGTVPALAAAGLGDVIEGGFPSLPLSVSSDRFVDAVIRCSGSASSGGAADGGPPFEAAGPVGPLVRTRDQLLVSVTPRPDPQPQPCNLGEADPSTARRWLDALRFVNYDEWAAYMARPGTQVRTMPTGMVTAETP